MTSDERKVLTGSKGQPLATFLRTTRDGLPAADLVEPTKGSDLAAVANAAIAAFPGWAFSAPPDLGRLLLERGATPLRHAHWLARDFVADPPEPTWSRLESANPDLAIGPASTVPMDYLDAAEAAYPPGHPDYEPRESAEERMALDITPLLDGTLGPLLAASTVARDAGRSGALVAVCLVTDRTPEGPWVVEVFRRPEPRYAGLGRLLLRRTMAGLAIAGYPVLGLTVTEGNPARATYDRLGFQPVLESLTVRLPSPRRSRAGGNS